MKTMKISDHRRVFYDGMKKIHHSRKYSDIILITGGRQFHCHRIILSAFIPGWDRLRYAAPNSKILVGHISPKFLERWLSLAYLGETEVPQTEKANFIAESFIKGDYEESISKSKTFSYGECNTYNIKLKDHYETLVQHIFNGWTKTLADPGTTDDQLIFTCTDESMIFKKIDIHRIIIDIFSPEAKQMFDEPKNLIYIMTKSEEPIHYACRLIYTGNSGEIEERYCEQVMQILRSMSCKGDVQIE